VEEEEEEALVKEQVEEEGKFKMHIGGIQFPVFKPYKKAAYEIYVSGCKRNCHDCHNPELQNFNFGEKLDLNKLIIDIKKVKNLVEIISITGGDLLCNDPIKSEKLAGNIRVNFTDKELWLFTGANKKECPDWVWKLFDVVKLGHYDHKTRTGGFPASKNQKILKKGRDYK
jgi:anaerobic ribonucleoside-triphosphate reductase activating protein